MDNYYKRFLFILIIISIIFILGFVSTEGYAISFEQFAVERAMFINHKWCQHRPELNVSDSITEQQANTRVGAVVGWSEHLNYMYPSIHYKRVAKDMLSIVELETGFVNYDSYIDNGTSFGVFSMQWTTAKWIAEVNGWSYNRHLLVNDTTEQAKYAVWYYYYQLNRKGDRISAIMAYNNPSINAEEERWRKYVMEVLGRIVYNDKLIQERVTY